MHLTAINLGKIMWRMLHHKSCSCNGFFRGNAILILQSLKVAVGLRFLGLNEVVIRERTFFVRSAT
jgi:hypothetical protein